MERRNFGKNKNKLKIFIMSYYLNIKYNLIIKIKYFKNIYKIFNFNIY